MQELFERVAAAAGIDLETAEKSIGLILGFLKKEAPEAEMGQLFAAMPGAAETAVPSQGDGIMGLAGALTVAGLGMGEMQAVGKELFAYSREKAGEDAVGAIAGAVPGLSQFT